MATFYLKYYYTIVLCFHFFRKCESTMGIAKFSNHFAHGDCSLSRLNILIDIRQRHTRVVVNYADAIRDCNTRLPIFVRHDVFILERNLIFLPVFTCDNSLTDIEACTYITLKALDCAKAQRMNLIVEEGFEFC